MRDVATTVSIAVVTTAMMNPSCGRSTEAGMTVVARKSGSTPCGGERRGAPGCSSTVRPLLDDHGIVGIHDLLVTTMGAQGFSGRRATTTTSWSALSGGPGVAQATPTSSLQSAARGRRGAR
jgi:hypothetical protein